MNLQELERAFNLRKAADGVQAAARRTFVSSAVKGINSEARTIRAYASTKAWDRYGERFEADAFKDGLGNFKKNPVILFGHDYYSAPIAKATGYEFDENGLILTMKFADTEKAKEIFALYEGGFMSAFSVGFRPLEYRFEERVIGSGQMGAVFVKAELLENSAVPVPANPEAVVIKGLQGKTMTLTADTIRDLLSSPYRIDSAERAEEEQAAPAVPAEVPAPAAAEPEAAVPAADPAPAATPEPAAAPAEEPKSLKEAVGYLLTLGKAARENGKVEDAAVRSLLVQAVNLCRELVLGPGAQSLDGMDADRSDDLSAEEDALLKEFAIMTDKLMSSGKATQKDIDELRKVGQFIEEEVLKNKI